MFEGRLKIFLFILVIFVTALLARAVELQVFEHDYWTKQAAKSMEVTKWIETSRGKIYDCKQMVLAEDQPCVDACVDYRAIVLEPPEGPDKPFADGNVNAWANTLISKRVKEQIAEQPRGSVSSEQRKQMAQDEKLHLINQIDQMWGKLADLSGKSREEIEDLRQSIQKRVEMRKRIVAYQRFNKALLDSAPKEDPPWYRKWLMGEATDMPGLAELEKQTIGEEQSSHIILEAIDTPTQNELLKHADDYPGLTLVPSTHRYYPYGAVACQLIGHLGKVQKEDLESNAKLGDDRSGYTYNDVIGRDGLEALGEPTLRGKRGKNIYDGIGDKLVSGLPAEPGGDLYSTIDIELQAEIQEQFTHVDVPYDTSVKPARCDTIVMHGAAVVIDVETSDVKALVSYPDYDLNAWDKLYPTLAQDSLNAPLRNRATQSMFEPGSTVKPVVGTGAITQGVIDVNKGIECNGYLQIGGHTYKGFGRCWTASNWEATHTVYAHHSVPYPHQGHDGNADGWLTFSDALERSCNVYFETVADGLKIEGLTYWMKQYGLGRPTGIGIAEVRGRVPDSFLAKDRQFATWTAGIGQGPVAATPLQMCNVAATVARRGIWMRPNLVKAGYNLAPYRPKSTSSDDATWEDIPSRMDLHIAPVAIDAAIDGMTRVVNSKSGTGTTAHRDDIVVAGKTGTAQAAPFMVAELDALNRPVLDEQGKPVRVPLTPSTHVNPDKFHPWYRATDDEGKKLNHAWFIGFVPAEHPKYAISVMVEYGGGGGGAVAGPIAKHIIDALIEHQYLQPGTAHHNERETID